MCDTLFSMAGVTPSEKKAILTTIEEIIADAGRIGRTKDDKTSSEILNALVDRVHVLLLTGTKQDWLNMGETYGVYPEDFA